MENLSVRTTNDINTLVSMYQNQMTNAMHCSKGYEEHHQNGTVHHNSPGTGWEQSHNNSYFSK